MRIRLSWNRLQNKFPMLFIMFIQWKGNKIVLRSKTNHSFVNFKDAGHSINLFFQQMKYTVPFFT